MATEAAVTRAAPETASIPRISTFHSLRYFDYRMLFFGQIGAAGSNWMEQLARPLLMLHLTDSALMVGLITATRMIPQLILGVWAGVIADRMDKRRILLLSKGVTLAMHFTTAVIILSGIIEPWMVFVTTFITGSAMAFDNPARQSLIPRMVPPDALANAVALNSAAMQTMRIGGPSLAGVVLIFAGLGELYLLQSIVYVSVIYCTLRIRTRTNDEPRADSSMFSELIEGFAAVQKDKVILYILLMNLVLFVFGFPYQHVFVPLIALETLDIGESGAGVLISVTGIGALVGSLTVATYGDRLQRRGLIMFAMIGIFASALLIFSRVGSVYLAVPALILTGAMQVSFMALNTSFVLARTAPELQGRIMSLFSLDRGLVPLGATLGGVLATALGPQDGLTAMAALCLGFGLLMALLLPSLRRLS
jgi:MFS family permease